LPVNNPSLVSFSSSFRCQSIPLHRSTITNPSNVRL
jgi:hypothetical protein